MGLADSQSDQPARSSPISGRNRKAAPTLTTSARAFPARNINRSGKPLGRALESSTRARFLAQEGWQLGEARGEVDRFDEPAKTHRHPATGRSKQNQGKRLEAGSLQCSTSSDCESSCQSPKKEITHISAEGGFPNVHFHHSLFCSPDGSLNPAFSHGRRPPLP